MCFSIPHTASLRIVLLLEGQVKLPIAQRFTLSNHPDWLEHSFESMEFRLHAIVILIRINDLTRIRLPRKRDSGTGAGILQNCSLLSSFLPWLPLIISANQPTSLASLGGSHGKLRRVDAKPT